MNWYQEAFLPSLITRAEQNGGKMWLTVKQAAIMRQHLEIREMHDALGVHLYGVVEFDNHKIIYQHSKKSGAGSLTVQKLVYLTTEETQNKENEKERKTWIKYARSGEHYFTEKLKDLEISIADYKKWIADDEAAGDNSTTEDDKTTLNKLEWQYQIAQDVKNSSAYKEALALYTAKMIKFKSRLP